MVSNESKINTLREALSKFQQDNKSTERLLTIFSISLFLVGVYIIVYSVHNNNVSLNTTVAPGGLIATFLYISFYNLQAIRACRFECDLMETKLNYGGVNALMNALESTKCIKITSSIKDFMGIK